MIRRHRSRTSMHFYILTVLWFLGSTLKLITSSSTDCIPLNHDHGSQSTADVKNGTNVTLTCDTGYALIGETSALCTDGNWSNTLGNCIKESPSVKLVPELNDCWLLEGSPLKLDCIYTRPKNSIPLSFDFYFNGFLVENNKNGFTMMLMPWVFDHDNLISTLTLTKNSSKSNDSGTYECKTEDGNLESRILVHLLTAQKSPTASVIRVGRTSVLINLTVERALNPKLTYYYLLSSRNVSIITNTSMSSIDFAVAKLIPGTYYIIKIYSSLFGWPCECPWSQGFFTVPSMVSHVVMDPMNSTTLNISWAKGNGSYEYFIIDYYNCASPDDENQHVTQGNTTQLSMVKAALLPGTLCNVSVTAHAGIQTSDPRFSTSFHRTFETDKDNPASVQSILIGTCVGGVVGGVVIAVTVSFALLALVRRRCRQRDDYTQPVSKSNNAIQDKGQLSHGSSISSGAKIKEITGRGASKPENHKGGDPYYLELREDPTEHIDETIPETHAVYEQINQDREERDS